MTDTEAVTKNHLPTWMVLVGILLAIVGVVMMVVAGNKHEYAVGVDSFTRAMGSTYEDPAIQHWVTVGHWGLGLLITGGVVAVLGVMAQAVRR